MSAKFIWFRRPKTGRSQQKWHLARNQGKFADNRGDYMSVCQLSLFYDSRNPTHETHPFEKVPGWGSVCQHCERAWPRYYSEEIKNEP